MPLVVLTGATRGIGAAAAVALARRGAALALVGRDPARLAETARAARAAGAQVSEHAADLERMDEVRRLAGDLLERHERIDVLANNAGAMFTERHVTADGFERTFALNHLAPFLLTNLLLERLEASDARVVTTASGAHTAGALDFEDLQAERSFKPMGTYGTTKLCNILFTRELARRSQVTANCFHPGVVRTGFGKNDGLLYRIGLTVIGPVLRSPDRGARSLVWLALSEEAGRLDGAYVVDEKPAPSSTAAQDEHLAQELWRRSAQLVGL